MNEGDKEDSLEVGFWDLWETPVFLVSWELQNNFE